VQCPDCGTQIPGGGADLSGCPEHLSRVARPVKDESPQLALLEVPTVVEEHWWGMPSFIVGDATPNYRVTVNFMTREDLDAFRDLHGGVRLDAHLGGNQYTMWFPPGQLDVASDWAYVDG
jgi:hypothetical protein